MKTCGGNRGIADAFWYRYTQGSETWVSRFVRITALSSGIETTMSVDDTPRDGVDAFDMRKLFCSWEESHLNLSLYEHIASHDAAWAISASDILANQQHIS